MKLTELGLTPTQLAELERLEQPLVEAWLEALAEAPSAVRSPVGWFLAGVRSGNLPGAVPEPERLTRVRLAESYVRNAGLYLPTEAELLDELFGYHGRLKQWADDQALRSRLVSLWQGRQDAAARVEREMVERANRNRPMRSKVPDIPWPRVRQQAYADSRASMRPA